MTAYIEVGLSWLLKNAKGRDAKSFYTYPAFEGLKEPTITITSPDCGDSPATLGPEYIAEGGGKIPSLQWTAPPEIAGKVKEWLLIVEDPDAPIPTPPAHALFPGIPAEKTSVVPEDFEIKDPKTYLLKGGFYYGKNLAGQVYIPPRPLMNHGPHRYFYQVIALNAPLDPELLKKRATREKLGEAIKGKVLAWGNWIGSAERKLK